MPKYGLVPFGPPRPPEGTELYRAWEKLAYLNMEMEGMEFTPHEGKSTVTWTCPHGDPPVYKITVSRTLKAFRDGYWDDVVSQARREHRQVCPR